ncbi:VOC family protein [Nioella nitratireducens]|uniref:VOC family protein n=1 Tax=Nioella nitratireducens TaxID=1287720 RepID=UPI0008FD3F1D|nr:VOC family protein [Nioella nitratireducens]
MLTFDHLAISCDRLAAGVAHVEAALGVPLAPGGEHPAMGTHNKLLSLGPEEYLEVIAINPDAPGPDQPRWFDIDNFAGAPRVSNWICRCPDLTSALAAAPAGTGVPWDLERGDLRWRMAVPTDGKLPFDNAFPALIEWQGDAHPAPRLPDRGVRLTALHLTHPEAEALRMALGPLIAEDRLTIAQGPTPALEIDLTGPKGTVRL